MKTLFTVCLFLFLGVGITHAQLTLPNNPGPVQGPGSVFTLPCNSSDPYCIQNGQISREVLENYLSRAITMQGLSMEKDLQHPAYTYTEADRLDDIRMIKDLGIKFVGRMAHWWSNYPLHVDTYKKRVEENIQAIKANDPDVICQAGIFEYVNINVHGLKIDDDSWLTIAGYIPSEVSVDVDKMIYDDQKYSYHVDHYTEDRTLKASVPDITKVDTRVFFYQLAKNYIDMGCEAIHFGQAEGMNRYDVGNRYYYQLVQAVRNYGKTKNRGFVLCDAHTPGGGMYYEPDLLMPVEEWQTYVPTNDRTKQLIWDFHSQGVKFSMNWDHPDLCERGKEHGKIEPHNPSDSKKSRLYQRSLGGLNPLGWYTASNPYLIEFDHGSIERDPVPLGCDYPYTGSHRMYGWDEMSWFAYLKESRRNDVLKYSFYKSKCLDRNSHLQFAGFRKITNRDTFSTYNSSTQSPESYTVVRTDRYKANAPISGVFNDPNDPRYFNQEGTIKEIWDGLYASPHAWVRNDFSDYYVGNSPVVGDVKEQVTVGDSHIFYVGTDNQIHGYKKEGKFWTVSNPYANKYPVPQPAASGLVLNPSQTHLYYIGQDGYIYGYTINSNGTYTYSGLSSNSNMQQQGLQALGNLVCTSDDRLYYIAYENNSNTRRVHGLIKYGANWLTTSPSYAAGNVSAQVQPQEELVANPSGTYLYYAGNNGLIYRYQINSNWSYTYSEMPSNTSMTQNNIRYLSDLICTSDNRIYYIGRDQSLLKNVILSLEKVGNTWMTVNPSINLAPHLPSFIQPSSKLCFESNNKVVVFLGNDQKLNGYRVNYDNTFEIISLPAVPVNKKVSTDITIGPNGRIYYASNATVSGDNKLHYYEYGPAHCNNPVIQAIEPGQFVYRQASSTEPETGIAPSSIKDQSFSFIVSPNPVQGDRILLTFQNLAVNTPVKLTLRDIQGRIVEEYPYTFEGSSLKWNVEGIHSGIYFLSITTDQHVHTQKLIITN